MTNSSRADIPLATFRTLVQAAQVVNCECLLNITERGIDLLLVDTANVAMVSAKIPGESLGHGHYGLCPQVIGVDLAQLHSSLKPLPNAAVDLIIFNDGEFPRDHANKLIIRAGWFVLGVKLLDPTTVKKQCNYPNLDQLSTEIAMDPEHFRTAIQDLAPHSDKICIEVVENEGFLSGQGNASKLVILPCPFIITGGPARSFFCLDYLRDIARVMEGARDLKIRIGTDYPASFSFSKDGVKIEYILAPRIPADEEADAPVHWNMVSFGGGD